MRHTLILTILAAGVCLGSSGADNSLTAEEKKAGWQLLFDGKTTKGWHSFKKESFPEKGWVVENGVLKLDGKSRPGDIVSKQKFSEFELAWDWRIPAGANNGLKYFVVEERPQALGHEYQMIDDAATRSAPKHSTGAFYDVLPPAAAKPLKPPGEWNHSRVLVKGNHVEHWLNGQKVLEYELGGDKTLKAVAQSKFKEVEGFGKRQNGHIMLTEHQDPVEYKNIKIRDLAAD